MESNMGRDKENLSKWRKENQRRFDFYLNKESEKDVLEFLESKPNRREYIISLIRKDMNGHSQPNGEKV